MITTRDSNCGPCLEGSIHEVHDSGKPVHVDAPDQELQVREHECSPSTCHCGKAHRKQSV